jgi:hypothetical protein
VLELAPRRQQGHRVMWSRQGWELAQAELRHMKGQHVALVEPQLSWIVSERLPRLQSSAMPA